MAHTPQACWLLDRGLIASAVRAFVARDQPEYGRLMVAVWHADSEAALDAVRPRPWRQRRPKEFRELFGYLPRNQEGIDAEKQLPASLRCSVSWRAAMLKGGRDLTRLNPSNCQLTNTTRVRPRR